MLKWKLIVIDDVYWKMVKRDIYQGHLEKSIMTVVYKKANTHKNVIIDGARGPAPKYIKTILLYTPFKQLIRNVKNRLKKSSIHVKSVLSVYATLYKSTISKEKALDQISKKDILDILKLDKFSFWDETQLYEYANKMCDKIGFGNKNKIYVQSRINYDLTINTGTTKNAIKVIIKRFKIKN